MSHCNAGPWNSPCQGTHSICSRGNLPVDVEASERGVGGQTFVPLTGPGLGDGLHEVLLQLTDVGMVLLYFFLRLI